MFVSFTRGYTSFQRVKKERPWDLASFISRVLYIYWASLHSKSVLIWVTKAKMVFALRSYHLRAIKKNPSLWRSSYISYSFFLIHSSIYSLISRSGISCLFLWARCLTFLVQNQGSDDNFATVFSDLVKNEMSVWQHSGD